MSTMYSHLPFFGLGLLLLFAVSMPPPKIATNFSLTWPFSTTRTRPIVGTDQVSPRSSKPSTSSSQREPFVESVNSQSSDGNARLPQLPTVWLVSDRQSGRVFWLTGSPLELILSGCVMS